MAMSKLPYSLSDFARYCLGLTLDNGKPFVLETFEKRMLRDYFAGATETVIIIPKKNGKTTLLAALALYQLDRRSDADVYIAATSVRQARILFRQAAAMVRRSKLDHLEIKSGYGEIRLKGDRERIGPRIQVISSEAGGEDGAIPTLALVDELHRHRDGELYGVLRDGLGPKSGQMITISTAGWNEDSPLGKLRTAGYAMPTFERKGTYNHARSANGDFVLHEWCLQNTDDLGDLKLVKRANPAPWHTLRTLRSRHDSPTTTPAQWARFACGVWTFGEEPWIEAATWDALGVDIGGVADGEQVWAAVDGGAVVVAAQREASVAVRAYFTANTFSAVEATVAEVSKMFDVRGFCYDRVGFQRSAELLQAEGVRMLELPHSPERLSMASATLYRMIQGQNLRHNGDPRLRQDVLRGRTKETERGWRFIKSVDCQGLIALAIAVHQATGQPPSVYETRGLVSV